MITRFSVFGKNFSRFKGFSFNSARMDFCSRFRKTEGILSVLRRTVSGEQHDADLSVLASVPEGLLEFEEGVGLAGKCAEMLKGAELKVQTLVKRAEGSFDVQAMDVSPEEDAGSNEED